MVILLRNIRVTIQQIRQCYFHLNQKQFSQYIVMLEDTSCFVFGSVIGFGDSHWVLSCMGEWTIKSESKATFKIQRKLRHPMKWYWIKIHKNPRLLFSIKWKHEQRTYPLLLVYSSFQLFETDISPQHQGSNTYIYFCGLALKFHDLQYFHQVCSF